MSVWLFFYLFNCFLHKQVFSAELVLSLDFTEGSGSTVSQGNNSGVAPLTGSPTWITSQEDGINGMSFSGSNYGKLDYTECCGGAEAFLEHSWTLEFLVQVTEDHEIDPVGANLGAYGTSGQHYAFEPHQNDFTTEASAGISIGTNGISVYEHSSGYMPCLIAIPCTLLPDQWYHVVLVYDEGTPSLYLQGHFLGSGIAGPKSPIYSPRKFGHQAYGGFVGNLAHIRLYSGVLDAQTIHENYRALFPLEQVISVDFTEGFGSTTSQGASYGGYASIIDATWITDHPYGLNFQNSQDARLELSYAVCCSNLNPSVADTNHPVTQFTVELLVSIPDLEHGIKTEGLSISLSISFMTISF